MKEADVNEAIVSLLGEGDVAPPSYSEAINAPPASASSPSPSPQLNDDVVQAAVLGAINKALSSPTTASPADIKCDTHSHGSRLDASKIQAILDGRATLVLYDVEKGQLWSEQGESSIQRRSSTAEMTVDA
jgi:hypothetical protein